jgi:dihydroflavonol-4-reductase
MEQKNLVFLISSNRQLTNKAYSFSSKKFSLLAFFLLGTISLFGQHLKRTPESTPIFISIETDPAFWAGTLQNSIGFDANINVKIARLRFGVLGYSGKWSGNFGKAILLTDDFQETDWETQWNGLGLETQYQFSVGLPRGGFQPGLRMQWNQFLYYQQNTKKGEANHFVLTPQIGFQWFPFKKLGLYVLPWAGIQIPTFGTNEITMNEKERSTRKMMPIVTAHIGWEFRL